MSKDGWKSAAAGSYKTLKETQQGKLLLAELVKIRSIADGVDARAYVKLEEAIKGLDVEVMESLAKGLKASEGILDKLENAAKSYLKFFNEHFFKKDGLAQSPDNDKFRSWAKESHRALVDYIEESASKIDQLRTKAKMLGGKKYEDDAVEDLNWELDEIDLVSILKTRHLVRLRYMQLPAKKVVCVAVKGKAGYKAAKNDVLRRDFFRAAHDACARLAGSALKPELEGIDKNIKSRAVDLDDGPVLMAKAFEAFEKEYARRADEAIQKVWSDFLKSKHDVKGQKISTASKLVGAGGGVVAGVVALKVGVLSVVGTPMGIAALSKSVVTLCTTVAQTFETADELVKEINDQLEHLRKEYGKEAGTLAVGKDVAKDVAARLTGLQGKTVSSARASIERYRDKTQDWNRIGTELGRPIRQCLAEVEALSRKIHVLKREGVKTKSLGELESAKGDTIAQLDFLLDKSEEMKSAYRERNKLLEGWEKKLGDLESKDLAEVSQKIQKWVVPLADLAHVTSVHGAVEKLAQLSAEYTIRAGRLGHELEAAGEAGQLLIEAADIARVVGK